MKTCAKVILFLLIIICFLWGGIPYYLQWKERAAIRVAAEYLAQKYETEMEYVPGSMQPLTLGDSAWDFKMRFQTKDTQIPFLVSVAFDLKPHCYEDGYVYIPRDGFISARFHTVARKDIQNLLMQGGLGNLIEEFKILRPDDATAIFNDLDEAMSQEEMAILMKKDYFIAFYFSSSVGQEKETIAQNILELLETMKNSFYTPDMLKVICEQLNISMVLHDWQAIDTTEQILELMEKM